jgi:heat-inducible transcriptional repressor
VTREADGGPETKLPGAEPEAGQEPLSERQCLVLRALVAAYVGEAAPVSSGTVSHLLPVPLSSASIRSTMAELEGLGLVEKPHASAGRVPTEEGLRCFVDRLLHPAELAQYERRSLQSSFEQVDVESVMQLVSRLLSERTHQLGFALAPRVERLVLRRVSLVRLVRGRVLVVLVSRSGRVEQRMVEEEGQGDQSRLDRMAASLNERVSGRTLVELRALLESDLRELRHQADRLVTRALSLGLRAFRAPGGRPPGELVITNRLGLLDQPEFRDPDRLRGLLEALETQERLVEVLDQVLDGAGSQVSVSFGNELEEPGLRQCALVAVPYGLSAGSPALGEAGGGPLGVLGVLGPTRMDYARIIPLVSYCSQLVTEKLSA